MVCLIISNLMFSFLLSCIIELYTFIPLTVSAIIHGIDIIFFRNIFIKNNITPFPVPKTNTIDEIVYPRQNPLKQSKILRVIQLLLNPLTIKL